MATVRLHTADAARGLRELEPKLTSAARQTLGQSAAFTAETARKTTAFKDRTGAGRASIVRTQRGEWSFVVRAGGARAPYMLWIEDGSSEHVIAARRARALRFVAAGQLRFARSVRHPGTKATHFMLDARNQGEAALHRFSENAFAAALH